MTLRTRETRRSALVNVPSFSRKDEPGRKTCAYLAVSFRKISWTMMHSMDASAAATCWVLGRSEERSVGKECVSTGRSRGWAIHYKKNKKHKIKKSREYTN